MTARDSETQGLNDIAIERADVRVAELAAALTARNVVYEGDDHEGLICPATVCAPAGSADRFAQESRAIWEWNRVWHDLYADATVGGHLRGLLAQCEYGLSAKAIAVQRESDVLHRDPRIGRIDSVALLPSQAVAEVQWKGGGEGFGAGLQSVYADVIPGGDRSKPLGGLLTDSWAEFYLGFASNCVARPFVVNSTRATWQQSEKHLIHGLGERGVDMAFVPRERIGRHIYVRNGRVYAPWEGYERPVDYISLDRMSEALPTALFMAVVRCYKEGRVHVEPPPTYLYSQKLGYAMPWHPEFRDAFSDAVRSVLIPTVWLNEGPESLAALASSVDHRRGEMLRHLHNWDDVQALPVNLRRMVVVKCASTNGSLNHGGRGVWRLGSAATLSEVVRRMERGEPWVAQPYVRRTWRAPLASPVGVTVEERSVHARFCLYVSVASTGATPRVLGGLGTLSTFWKASGKSASTDAAGRLSGSAFIDLRERVR